MRTIILQTQIDDLGRKMLFIAVAGTWIALQALLLSYCKNATRR